MMSNTSTQKPLLTAIPTLLVGTSMLIFLTVSFILYKRRLSLKRQRDTEYMRYYLYTHPGVSQEEYETKGIPIRNKVSVMTNTHFADINELFIMDRTEHENVEGQNGRTKSKRKKNRKHLSCKQTQVDASFSNISETKAKTESITNYAFGENVPVVNKMESLQDNSKNQRNKSKKRKRKFLKFIGRKDSSLLKDVGSKDTIIELEEVRRTEKETYVPIKQSRMKNKYESGNPFCEGGIAYQAPRTVENVYYEDVVLSVNHTTVSRNKKIRKAETIQETGNILKLSKPDSVKQNAFYDRMTFVQEPKKRYKELVHRDSHGNIAIQCRSLPQLDTDFNDTVLFKDNKTSLEREKNLVSNPETFDHLHEYDILF